MTANRFSAEVVQAVLHHMNDDHLDDSLQIVRALVNPGATAATMSDCDQFAGTWEYQTADGQSHTARIEWEREALERKDLKDHIVALLERAQHIQPEGAEPDVS